jgi:hypothetical protein
LGDLTNELDADDEIVEFVSSGPKSYGYRTRKGKTVVKVKGFTMTSANAPAFSFENFRDVILNGVRTNEDVLSADDSPRSSSKKRVGVVAGRKRPRESATLRADFLKDHEADKENCSALGNEQAISTYNPFRIYRSRDFRVLQRPDQKIFTCVFNKRIILSDYSTIPFGYVCDLDETVEMFV